jgi:hypothetical protein
MKLFGKFIARAVSCIVIVSMQADAGEADTFQALLGLANKGDAEAQYHVGMMHNNGIGTQKDPRQAFEWFQKSAASNNPLGAYKLGCYYDGQGAGIVGADSNEALKYKLVSAKAGYALAQHDVARAVRRADNEVLDRRPVGQDRHGKIAAVQRDAVHRRAAEVAADRWGTRHSRTGSATKPRKRARRLRTGAPSLS